jgi:hypothetical protein
MGRPPLPLNIHHCCLTVLTTKHRLTVSGRSGEGARVGGLLAHYPDQPWQRRHQDMAATARTKVIGDGGVHCCGSVGFDCCEVLPLFTLSLTSSGVILPSSMSLIRITAVVGIRASPAIHRRITRPSEPSIRPSSIWLSWSLARAFRNWRGVIVVFICPQHHVFSV